MALNMVHRYTKTEIWPVPTGTAPGTAVLGNGIKPGVTLTGSGDYTRTISQGPNTFTWPAGGIGLGNLRATVAVDGAFKFTVAGAVASTPENTPVYAIVSAGVVTGLTLTVGSNVLFGRFDRLIGLNNPAESSVWLGQ
jgi:hypothetical protein